MKDLISALVQQAIEALQSRGEIPADANAPIRIEHTRDKAHGDFACNIAMGLAKSCGQSPRALAHLLVSQIPEHAAIQRIDIAGPGFINFYQSEHWLTDQLSSLMKDEKLGIATPAEPQTVVVDYSSPNLAKEMHVGHLRSTIIGDAVARTLEFLGHRVIRQNHVGDWGTQFGMLLALLAEHQDRASLTAELTDLERFYREAKSRFDTDQDFAKRARDMVVALQSGDANCLRLWEDFNRISMQHCFEVYARLGVSLKPEHVRGESTYNDDLPQVVADLDQQGMLTESDGALCVFLDEFKGKDGEPLPVIIRKTGGGYLYATTDLAALRYRQSLGAQRILYFVDQRQALHFQQIFTVAHKAGFVEPGTKLEHLGFGTMNGPDGKPFKTRSGGTVRLIDLLTEAEERALALVRKKNPDTPDEELMTIARTTGIGAVKYADLSKHRTSDYIFNYDQMLSFEGNTAPYLLYAWTRIASIFRKASVDPEHLSGTITLDHTAETELGNHLVRFPEVLALVAERGQPHLLCTYLYELAGLFSTFYENCPILSADNDTLRLSRMQLAHLTSRTLKEGLALLGIDTLERM